MSRATDQWLSILREMERQGETGSAAYDRYYDAYLGCKRQQKAVELQLFNARTQCFNSPPPRRANRR